MHINLFLLLLGLLIFSEFFFTDKEKDIETANHIIRKELDSEKMKQNNLMKEMQLLQQQLTEAKNGLLAAARISDQLEISQVTIAQLKEECKYELLVGTGR